MNTTATTEFLPERSHASLLGCIVRRPKMFTLEFDRKNTPVMEPADKIRIIPIAGSLQPERVMWAPGEIANPALDGRMLVQKRCTLEFCAVGGQLADVSE